MDGGRCRHDTTSPMPTPAARSMSLCRFRLGPASPGFVPNLTSSPSHHTSPQNCACIVPSRCRQSSQTRPWPRLPHGQFSTCRALTIQHAIQAQSDKHLPSLRGCAAPNLQHAAQAGELLFIRPTPSQLLSTSSRRGQGCTLWDFLPEAVEIDTRDPRRLHYLECRVARRPRIATTRLEVAESAAVPVSTVLLAASHGV